MTISNKSISNKAVVLAVSGAFALSIGAASVHAASNPFAIKSLASGYQVAEADSKMKDGKCGTGKCGANKKKTSEKKVEGKCSAEMKKEMSEKAKEGSCSAEKAAEGKCSAEGKSSAEMMEKAK